MRTVGLEAVTIVLTLLAMAACTNPLALEESDPAPGHTVSSGNHTVSSGNLESR